MPPIIDANKCIGCGSCPVLAPNTFIMNEDGTKAELTGQPGDDELSIQMAADSCPTGAIII